MDNNEKATIMQFHYKQIGQDAPFMLRASGKFEWFEGYSEPTEAELNEWETKYNAKSGFCATRTRKRTRLLPHILAERSADDVTSELPSGAQSTENQDILP